MDLELRSEYANLSYPWPMNQHFAPELKSVANNRQEDIKDIATTVLMRANDSLAMRNSMFAPFREAYAPLTNRECHLLTAQNMDERKPQGAPSLLKVIQEAHHHPMTQLVLSKTYDEVLARTEYEADPEEMKIVTLVFGVEKAHEVALAILGENPQLAQSSLESALRLTENGVNEAAPASAQNANNTPTLTSEQVEEAAAQSAADIQALMAQIQAMMAGMSTPNSQANS